MNSSAATSAADFPWKPLGATTAAVVGATGSIGRGCAELLAEEAADLILIGRREVALEELRSRLEGHARARLRTSTRVNDIAQAQLILTVTSAIHEVVPVDYNVPGCPPDADTIFYVLAELAQGRKPELKDELLQWH